jgi:hypothetical protein
MDDSYRLQFAGAVEDVEHIHLVFFHKTLKGILNINRYILIALRFEFGDSVLNVKF